MQSLLEVFLTTGVLSFILTFARVGTALMIMPGIGDSFVPERVRLHMVLGVTFVLFPILFVHMPAVIPSTYQLIAMVGVEVLVGLLIGTVARIFMMALDTAGMIISMQSGLANAQVFNPALSSQGSIMGAFLTVTGIVFVFATNMHHFLISGLVESYSLFPLGQVPDTGSMAEVITKAVNASFIVGVQMAMPFLIVTLLMYTGMGVLARLMPQVQVFMVALPLQILISLILLNLVLTALFYHWLGEFESAMMFFLGRR